MARHHDARMWRKAEDGAAECFLCAHRCRVGVGKRGVCDVRENTEDGLKTLTYGQVIAANADPIEKKPLYHFLPGTRSYSIATPGCNFRCSFCQNWQISQIGGAAVAGRMTSPEEVVAEARRAGCKSVAYTYTEPTIFFEFAEDCARAAREEGLKNCFVTNGYQTPETLDAMAGLIDAANVDLKAFDDAFYRKLCKARLQPVLDTIRGMVERGILVEVTTLLIPGRNDDTEELRRLADFLAGVSPDLPWHVSRYHPDYEFREPATPPESVFRATEIGKEAGLRYVYAGNLRGGDLENTFCPSCHKGVIRRSGFRVDEVNLDGTRCAFCGQEIHLIV